MNCANHAEASAVAYCRTCGKALCANCTRPVKGVIYCEDCLGAKMEGTVPPAAAAFAPGAAPAGTTGYIPAPVPPGGTGPNPGLAGILGAIPLGIGAVYNGQYAKGLAHLIIFGLLWVGASASGPGSDVLNVLCGIGIAFFWVYQIVDAVRTARALQVGQPTPDPFGLARNFAGGENIDARKIPMGAIVLILVGVLFLLHTIGLTEFRAERFWPVLLIVLGVWLFVRNWGLLGQGCEGCACDRCRSRRLTGPAVLFTVGTLFLLENMGVAGFGRTWPILLLVIGGVKLFQSSASGAGHVIQRGPGSGPANTGGGATPASSAPPSEVNHG